MNRGRLIAGVCILAVAGVFVWIARSTVWVDVTVPMPPRGDAARDPLYAAERFVRALGARAIRHRTLTPLPPEAVLVLSDWRWNLSHRRREALTRWVESGGRLVVGSALLGDSAFERWSGVERRVSQRKAGSGDARAPARPDEDCRSVREWRGTDDAAATAAYSLCDEGRDSYLASARPPTWSLRDDQGLQAVRVAAGRGSVTVANGRLFEGRALLRGDHAAIFVTATQVRRGDEVHLLSESDHPALLALAWREGAAIVLLTLGGLALALWRGATRFGPPAAEPSAARRSLAEQILGTGRFAVARGDQHALHAAVVRALGDAARRRIPDYARLGEGARAGAVAALTGMDAEALNAALHHPEARRPERIGATLALLELTRRRALLAQTRSSHGTS